MCPEWKTQQRILWEEVRKETERWKSRSKIWDLLADEVQSGGAEFLSSTDVGRQLSAAEEDTVSEVSEAELWEWEEE